MERTAYKKNKLMVFKNLSNKNEPYFKAYHEEAHKLEDGTWETTLREPRFVNVSKKDQPILLGKFNNSTHEIIEAEVYEYTSKSGKVSFWLENIK